MNRKMSVRVICLITAMVVLSGSVAFAAVMGSPYETLKRALLNAATYTNATMESHFVTRINGEVAEAAWELNIRGDNGYLDYLFDENGEVSGYSYYANGLSFSDSVNYTSQDGTQWYNAYVNPPGEIHWRQNSLFGLTQDDLDSAQMRFAELLVDLIVGDLKNNVTMTSDNGIRTIRGTITGNQLPEIVRAGLDMALEATPNNYWYRRVIGFPDGKNFVYEDINVNSGMKTVSTWSQPARIMTADEENAWNDGTFWEVHRDIWGVESDEDGTIYVLEGLPSRVSENTVPATRSDFAGQGDGSLNNPMTDITIDFVRGEAEVDSSGNLISVSISTAFTVTDIFGNVSDLEANYSVRFTDIGTSIPVSPIPGAEQILTSGNMKERFGTERARVYFTLNENGTINVESITTAFPGEKESAPVPIPVP